VIYAELNLIVSPSLLGPSHLSVLPSDLPKHWGSSETSVNLHQSAWRYVLQPVTCMSTSLITSHLTDGIWSILCICDAWILLMMHRGDSQLDSTEWFIALVICSTCFGHLYPHHQELETILVLLPRMVCNALVASGRRSGAGQQAMRPGWGKLLE